jgi:hypothetical protein
MHVLLDAAVFGAVQVAVGEIAQHAADPGAFRSSRRHPAQIVRVGRLVQA